MQVEMLFQTKLGPNMTRMTSFRLFL